MTILGEIADLSAGIGFGISGGGPSLEVVDALQRGGGFYTTRFEGSAALMAGTVGRLTGRPGVAVSIKGPGLANLSAGLATTMLEDLPLLAVTEAYGRTDGSAKAHKRLDQDGVLQAVSKARLGSGEKDVVSQLVSIATAERPGPVVLELADTDGRIAPTAPTTSARNDDAALQTISKSKRPVVIAGGLALRKGWSDLLNGLRVPTFSTASAKGVVNETLPHAAGPYTGVGRGVAPECELLKDADLVIGIGLRSHEVLSAACKIPCVNFDDLDLAPGFSFEATCTASAVPRALELIGSAAWGSNRIAELKARMRSELLAGPFLPAQAFACLAEAVPDARMVLDTGYFCTIGEHMWDVSAPDLYISSAQGRSMGAALPMAVAAALCRRDEPTILAIGDGGIGMFVAELALAVSEKLPLLVVFMRDGTHASVRERAVSKGLNQAALIANTPDWAKVASAMGFQANTVDKPEDLVSFARKWDRDGPAFVQVDFAPKPYLTMTSNLRA